MWLVNGYGYNLGMKKHSSLDHAQSYKQGYNSKVRDEKQVFVKRKSKQLVPL